MPTEMSSSNQGKLTQREFRVKVAQLVGRAKEKFPFWVKLETGKGPDPRMLPFDIIRFPLSNGQNMWCFVTIGDRNYFIGKHGGELYDKDQFGTTSGADRGTPSG